MKSRRSLIIQLFAVNVIINTDMVVSEYITHDENAFLESSGVALLFDLILSVSAFDFILP